MADLVNNFNFGESSSNVSYPWEEWTDGQTRKAIKGTDFNCTIDSFIAGLYRMADRKKIKVQVHKEGDSCVFSFTVS